MEKQTKEQIPSVEEYWKSKSQLTYAEWVYQQGKTQPISEEIEFLQDLYNNIELDYEGDKTGRNIKQRLAKLQEIK